MRQHPTGRALILVVADESGDGRTVSEVLTEAGHDVRAVGRVGEARSVLSRRSFDLMLCDTALPGEPVELVRQVAVELPDTGVLVISGGDTAELGDDRFGALTDRPMVKPLQTEELLVRVAMALRRRDHQRASRAHVDELESKVVDRSASLQRALRLIENNERSSERSVERETADHLAAALTRGNEETYGHLQRMSRYAALVVQRSGAGAWPDPTFRVAAMLHDVGKIAVPDSILLKPGAVEPHEQAVVERHAVSGYRLLVQGQSETLALGAEIALSHHERWDGSGYPLGLSGEAIPVAGRITAIADVYDALTSARVHRPGIAPEQAIDLMRAQRHLFDPDLLDLFSDVMDDILAIGRTHLDTDPPDGDLRVLVAMGYSLLGEALAQRLRATPGIAAVVTVASVEEARESLRSAAADSIVIDAAALEAAGHDRTRRLREDVPDASFLLLTDTEDDAKLLEAVDVGCTGLVSRQRALEEVVPAVLAERSGAPTIWNSRLALLLRRPPTAIEPPAGLTNRDAAVLRLMREGLSDPAIGERLGLPPTAITEHIGSLLAKLGVSTRLQALLAWPGGAAGITVRALVPPADAAAEEYLVRATVPLALIGLATGKLVMTSRDFNEMFGLTSATTAGVEVLDLVSQEERPLMRVLISGLERGVIDDWQGRTRVRAASGREIGARGWIGRLHGRSEALALWAVVPALGSADPVPWRLAIAGAGGAVVFATVDHDWRFTDISADATALFGWDPADYRHTPLLSTAVAEDVPRLLLAIGRSAAEGRSCSTQLHVRGADGGPRVVECELSPLCRHSPARFGVTFRPLDATPAVEPTRDRTARLEQHLWRIGLEVHEAHVGDRPWGDEDLLSEPALQDLSVRQWQILRRLTQGATPTQIAGELFLSPSTVRNHLAAVYRKVGVHSQQQLLARLRVSAHRSRGDSERGGDHDERL